MSNDINLSIIYLLSLDSTDDEAEVIPELQDAIIASEAQRGTPEGKFTEDYWNNNPWHFKSLKTLLGDSSDDWYLKKIQVHSQPSEVNEMPYLMVNSEISDLAGRDFAGYSFSANVNITIVSNSRKDFTKIDQIAKRIIWFLDHVKLTSPGPENGVGGLSNLVFTGFNRVSFDQAMLKYETSCHLVGI